MPAPIITTEHIPAGQPPSIEETLPATRRYPSIRALLQRVDRQGISFVAGVFVAMRLLYLLATAVAGQMSAPGIFLHPTPTPFWKAWFYWDSGYYASIAHFGYRVASVQHVPAFFPLFPVTARIFVPLTQGNYMLACFYAANVAWFVALYGLYRLARHDFDLRVARGAVIALAVFPAAFFGFVPYAESLFLALAIGAMLCMRQGKWAQAALWGMFASQTRLAGVMLVLPFLCEYIVHQGFSWQSINWQHVSWRQIRGYLPRADVLWVLLIPTGTLLYMLWLWIAVGDPLAFIHAEKSWHRELRFPLTTLWDGFWLAVHTQGYIGFRGWQEFSIVLIVLLIAFIGVRIMPLSYSVFSLSLMVLFLINPQHGFPLESQSRYAVELFPLFIVLGVLAARRRWLLAVIVAAFLPLQLVLMGIFSRSGWVT